MNYFKLTDISSNQNSFQHNERNRVENIDDAIPKFLKYGNYPNKWMVKL